MRLIFTLLLQLIVSFMLAQTSSEVFSVEDSAFGDYYLNPDNIPEVTGKILHLSPGDYKKAKIKYTVVTPLREFHDSRIARVFEDGTFQLKLDHAVPFQQIWLTMGPYYGVLYVKDGLHIELYMDKVADKRIRFYGEAVNFSGPDASLTTLMNKHILFKRKKQLELSSAEQKLSKQRELSYTDYKTKYDSIYGILNDLDADFIDQNPSEYSWLIKNERWSDYYSHLVVKHWDREMNDTLWEKIKNHKAYAVSNDGMLFYNYLFTYLRNLDQSKMLIGLKGLLALPGINKEEKNAVEELLSLSDENKDTTTIDTLKIQANSRIVNQLFQDYFNQIQGKRVEKTFEKVDSCFASPKADFLKLKMKDDDPEIQNYIDGIALQSMVTPWCIEALQQLAKKNKLRWKEINSALQNTTVEHTKSTPLGTPIMKFDFGAELYEIKDVSAKQLLSNIKSSFKDRALLLDFWAVWCAPCLQEFPYSKKLHDAVKEKPVEFIYLCTSAGGSIERWQKKIAEYKLDGIHLFVEDTTEAELMQLFNGQGFPTYAFIDKNGVYQPGRINRISHTQVEDLVRLIDAK